MDDAQLGAIVADKFDLKTFLLSPYGRVGRAPYFSFIAIVAMFIAVLSFGAGMAGGSSWVATAALIMVLMLVWPVWCVTARRLHDIGQPGAWAVILFIPELLTTAIIATGLDWLIYPQVAGVYIRWAFVMGMIVIPGTKMENRYGGVPEAVS